MSAAAAAAAKVAPTTFYQSKSFATLSEVYVKVKLRGGGNCPRSHSKTGYILELMQYRTAK